MANSPQAKKRALQNKKRRLLNASQRSNMRTYVKRVRSAIVAGDKTAAEEAFKIAVPILDRMSNKGIVPKNTAARYKSRLNAHIRAM